jgi:hypothetical protein
METLYQEAISHSRSKTILRRDVLSNPLLLEENLHSFSENTFEEILLIVKSICDNFKGIGSLASYDIASAICRYNKINIGHVYIIGGGPKRAIKLLNLKTKIRKQKIGGDVVKYIIIRDLLDAFQKINHELPPFLQNSINGDDYETYLCNWQKNILLDYLRNNLNINNVITYP